MIRKPNYEEQPICCKLFWFIFLPPYKVIEFTLSKHAVLTDDKSLQVERLLQNMAPYFPVIGVFRASIKDRQFIYKSDGRLIFLVSWRGEVQVSKIVFFWDEC